MTTNETALREALALAANRLARCALDQEMFTEKYYQVAEWGEEARAAAQSPSQPVVKYPGLPMSDADLTRHYEASKQDVVGLVGSEVRQIIGELRHYRAHPQASPPPVQSVDDRELNTEPVVDHESGFGVTQRPTPVEAGLDSSLGVSPDGAGLPMNGAAKASPPAVGIPDAVTIPNPVQWFYNRDGEAEWWHRGGKTRDEAIAKGAAEYEGEPFWISECKLMVPCFDIFDADDICERLSEDDEAWWEDGWTGEPNNDAKRELERRLTATFKQWFAEFATLDGACLDEISREHIAAIAIEARSAETVGLSPQGESADPQGIARKDQP